jgi:predicted O-methyltransferase YrrM
LDDCGKGHLYSIDPMDVSHCTNGCVPKPELYDANPIVHPRFTLIRKLSQDALYPLFDEVGPFDIFIHDSDHSEECQTYEFEAAWVMVKTGGIIVSDDCFWGQPPHLAWDKFLTRHGVKERTVMGNAQWIRKS